MDKPYVEICMVFYFGMIEIIDLSLSNIAKKGRVRICIKNY